MEGFFSGGGIFQGMRPVTTSCPLPSRHAAGTKKPRRPGGVNDLFAAADPEVQSRGSFDNDVNHHHEGREEWGDPDEWIASTTLARENSGPF